jgi:DNA primase
MNSDIEEIKSRLNIADIIGEYIRLDKAGANYRARCPFHNEKTPSFMVSAEKQIWHCFGCQKGGDVFGFVMEIEGLDFKETLKILAEKAGVPLKKTDFKAESKKTRTLEILELATKFYETQLWSGAGKIKILNYLKDRGLQAESIKEFRLGYAPVGWRNILTFLTGRGYSVQEIEKTGLLVKKENADFYDRFRDRIIFPIADPMGKVVGFSARVAPGGDESQAKYVNTPESEVYHKSRALYGIDKAKGEIKSKDYALLVEGNMDVVAAAQAGIKNTVAVSGTALTPDQINIVKRYTNNLKMFFDMDKAGEEATKKSLKLCFERDMNVKVVELPEGKDAADLAKSNPELLRAAVAKSTDAMEYFFRKVFSKENKEEVEGKKKIANEILNMIAHVFSEIGKNHWIKELGEEIGIKEAVLTDMLKKVTLRGRTVNDSGEEEENKETTQKSKLETLTEDLIGLMLVHENIWRRAFSEERKNQHLLKDGILSVMLMAGEELKFNFDNLIRKLEQPESVARAERIYFEKRYRSDLNNNIEEIVYANPAEDYAKCLKEIRRELQRNELERIEKDLKMAEKNKDREATLFLREEVKRISSDLTS